MNWTPVSERMPEPETECLVWTHPSWSKQPLALVDRWGEQHEAPVSWSSATIPIGLGWDESNFEDVSHWIPITPPSDSLAVEAPSFRLLTTADTIQPGDECLRDDAVTWGPLAGWEVGMRWHNGLMPLRRRISAGEASSGGGLAK